MAYFETARTITTGRLVDEPKTLDELLALPIHHDATCPECKSGGVSIRGELCQCRCGMRWRWPCMGMD